MLVLSIGDCMRSRCLEYFNTNHGTKRALTEYQGLIERLSRQKLSQSTVMN